MNRHTVSLREDSRPMIVNHDNNTLLYCAYYNNQSNEFKNFEQQGQTIQKWFEIYWTNVIIEWYE
jgi:hypothetical protein